MPPVIGSSCQCRGVRIRKIYFGDSSLTAIIVSERNPAGECKLFCGCIREDLSKGNPSRRPIGQRGARLGADTDDGWQQRLVGMHACRPVTVERPRRAALPVTDAVRGDGVATGLVPLSPQRGTFNNAQVLHVTPWLTLDGPTSKWLQV